MNDEMKEKFILHFMQFRWYLLIAFCSVSFYQEVVKAEPPLICVADNTHTANATSALCQTIGKTSKYRIECTMEKDRSNCLRRVVTGDADATVLNPENLIAAAAYSEYDILVTNELRLFPNERYQFEMVVLANKNIKGLSDLRDKGFCHPGFEITDEWSNVFSTYFENWIIFKECDFEKTLLENRINGLSKYFKAACISGSWSSDTELDSKLKSKYRNLCSLCDNPVGCYASDKYHGREGALLCLTDNVGDVAWVRLDDTLEHFKREGINKEDFNYICPDGTIRQLGADHPCVWITRPWPVIVSRRDVAERIVKLIASLNATDYSWQLHLKSLLENYRAAPINTENLETPQDFLRRFPGFLSANNRTPCRPSRTVRWCVSSSLEDQKCQWLRQAAYSYGIEPAISCSREPDRHSCIQALKNKRADVFVTKPDELLEARRNGLITILHAVSRNQQISDGIVAIVKQESSFKNLTDLRGARACFTGYRSVGWNTFQSIMRHISNGKWDCSDIKAIGSFFKEACVPDLMYKKGRESLSLSQEPPLHLYSLCKDTTVAGNDNNALDCLNYANGDVAFVNLKTLLKNKGGQIQGRNYTWQNKKYRTVCTKESSVNSDRACLLTWTTLASVMINNNTTELRREEIYSLLLEMDRLFGRTFHGRAPTFSLFGDYDWNHDILFPDETRRLQPPAGSYHIPGIPSYDDILQDLTSNGASFCVASNGMSFLHIHFKKPIFLYILALILSHIFISIS